MFNNDPSDVRGLEEIFQSSQFGRTSESAGAGPDTAGRSAAFQESIFRREFGHGTHATAPLLRSGERAGSNRRPPDDVVPAGSAVVPPPREAQLAPPSTPRKHDSNRYWAIAALCAAVALVAAGVTSGAGQHGPPAVSAQGHGTTGRPHHGVSPSGATSTGTGVVPGGSPVAAAGSAAPSLTAVHPGKSSASGNAPGGHVTLIGAATTNGTPVTASPGGSPTGTGGTPGSPPPPSGGNPVAPVATTVGSTVTAVGASITTVANQVGNSVPGTASVTNTVGSFVGEVGQAVGSTTG
jgi:hypothetical protein